MFVSHRIFLHMEYSKFAIKRPQIPMSPCQIASKCLYYATVA